MEATKKFRLKKQYKTLIWLAYACIIFFAAFLTTVFIIRKHSDADWSKPVILISLLTGLMLPLFMGIVFMTYSSFKRQELLNYRKQILVHRARKFASRTIELLQQGNVRAAVDEYIKCHRYPEHSLDDYVYGMLISACIQSPDEKLHKIGEEKFNKLRDEYDPEKCFSN
jgi:hypothetical protein